MRRLVAASAALLSLVACASPRNGLNTASASCFRALPAAEASVQRKGTLVGVRKVATSQLSGKVPQLAHGAGRDVCAIAFRAAFAPGDVLAADPPGPGGFALVVLDGEGSKVLATAVLDNLPVRFHHRA
ncbi:MAG: hypothetical protein M3066_20140 [Actinomycetota bacterium]|nr:hypothetical protein [Actinomycetota bacterium]